MTGYIEEFAPPAAVLLSRSEDENAAVIYKYQYKSPETGEVSYYTVTVQPVIETKLNDNSYQDHETQLLCFNNSEYALFEYNCLSDCLQIIPFSITETKQRNGPA